MYAYTRMGQARIQPRDFAAVLRANGLAGASLAGLERQRECQAEAEVDWLLKYTRVKPQASAPRISLLRQIIGGALVRVGEHLAGVCRSGVSTETAPAEGTIGMAH